MMKYIKCLQTTILMTALITNILHSTAVIFLEGSSRSGKSSICTAIKERQDWESISSLYLYYCHEVFNSIAPKNFAIITANIDKENITHAITKNIFVFKENISEEEKNNVRQAVKNIQNYFNDATFCTHHMQEFSTFALTLVRNHINNELNLLADVSWYVSQDEVKKINPTLTIISALAYCPFNIVIDRILHRNKICLETNDLMNYRFFKEPLKSFEALYDLSTEATGSIDILEKTVFFKCLDEVAMYLPVTAPSNALSDFIMQEMTQKQLRTYQDFFSKKFGNNEKLYVIPKKPYDAILRTDKYTPQECAKQIVDVLLNPSNNQRNKGVL